MVLKVDGHGDGDGAWIWRWRLRCKWKWKALAEMVECMARARMGHDVEITVNLEDRCEMLVAAEGYFRL